MQNEIEKSEDKINWIIIRGIGVFFSIVSFLLIISTIYFFCSSSEIVHTFRAIDYLTLTFRIIIPVFLSIYLLWGGKYIYNYIGTNCRIVNILLMFLIPVVFIFPLCTLLVIWLNIPLFLYDLPLKIAFYGYVPIITFLWIITTISASIAFICFRETVSRQRLLFWFISIIVSLLFALFIYRTLYFYRF